MYQLKHDGTIFKQFRQPAVVIHRPKVDDTGDYMCVAENSAGKIEYRFEIVVKGFYLIYLYYQYLLKNVYLV